MSTPDPVRASVVDEAIRIDLGDGQRADVYLNHADERVHVEMAGGAVSLDLHFTDANRLGIALTVVASGNAANQILPIDLSGRVAGVHRSSACAVVYFSLRPWVLRLDVDTALQLARALRREVAHG